MSEAQENCISKNCQCARARLYVGLLAFVPFRKLTKTLVFAELVALGYSETEVLTVGNIIGQSAGYDCCNPDNATNFVHK